MGSFIFSADNKILLGKGGVYQDAWIVGGGGIEDGETKLEAITREVWEEMGLDISQAKVELMPGTHTGKSEKVLRDTGERIFVTMTFYDFKIVFPQIAGEVKIKLADDFKDAAWFSAAEATQLNLGEGTKYRLLQMKFI